MLQYLIKLVLTAIVIVAAAEIGKRNVLLGAVIGSLPLVSILAVSWLWKDTGDSAKVADYFDVTFWLVIASLPMFLLGPALLRQGISFWAALAAGVALTIVAYGGVTWALARFGGQAS